MLGFRVESIRPPPAGPREPPPPLPHPPSTQVWLASSFRVQGLGFMGWCVGCRVQDSGCRVSLGEHLVPKRVLRFECERSRPKQGLALVSDQTVFCQTSI